MVTYLSTRRCSLNHYINASILIKLQRPDCWLYYTEFKALIAILQPTPWFQTRLISQIAFNFVQYIQTDYQQCQEFKPNSLTNRFTTENYVPEWQLWIPVMHSLWNYFKSSEHLLGFISWWNAVEWFVCCQAADLPLNWMRSMTPFFNQGLTDSTELK